MENIAVFFGGKSCEHDISIITGFQVCKNLNEKKYKIFPIYIDKNGAWNLVKKLESVEQFIKFKGGEKVYFVPSENILFAGKKIRRKLAKIDCAIIACHGMNGEDGTLQGLLEIAGVPYSSSGVAGSAIAMDKVFMKQIFEVNNLPITNYYWFKNFEYEKNPEKILKEIELALEYPLIVKPANLGSSIGITRSKNLEELKNAIQIALSFDTKILVEEVVPHLTEINCAVLGNAEKIILSNLEQPISWQEFLSFEQKYLQFTGVKFKKNNNPKISKKIKDKIKIISKIAFQKLDCSGVVRIDFLLNTDTEEIFINEINSIPGSFANFLFPQFEFKELLEKLIEFSKQKFAQKNSCTFTFDSDVLSKFSQNNYSKLNK